MMRKPVIGGALLLIFAPALFAQGDTQSKDAALAKEFAELQKAYYSAQSKYFEPYRNAKSEEEAAKIQLDPAKDPDKEYLPKFKAFAAKAGDRPAAAQAYLQITQFRNPANEADVASAYEKLTTTFVKQPLIENVARMLSYAFYGVPEKARMDKIFLYLDRIEKNGSENAKAAALFSKAAVIEDMKTVPDKDKRIAAYLDQVMQKYPNSPSAKEAKGKKYEAEFLSVGKIAPDFTATDENGESFKLSDYRGKIVVLDFWGFW